MRINSYLKAFLTTAIIVLTACENSVDFGEQYKKVLYIVNSNNILYKDKHDFDEQDDFINISVYCAGTKATQEDVSVKLGFNLNAFDSINKVNALADPLYVNKTLLPEDNYFLTNPTAIIKAGEEYGTLKIPFSFNGLNPDSSYVISLKIESNDRNYEINPELSTILYEIEMVNDFSGEYSGSSTELPETVRSVQPSLKAISNNVVRMPIHTLKDEVDDLKTNFMLLTIASDGVNVNISPWKNAAVTDLGGSTYNKRQMTFDLHYSFINNMGNEITVHEKIISLDKEKDDED